MLDSRLLTAIMAAVPAAAVLTAAPPDVIEIAASMPAAPPGELTAGAELTIELTMTVADGWSTSTAGMPLAFLQIDAPACVELIGTPSRTEKALFIDVPFERPIEAGLTSVSFRLVRQPAEGDRFGLNVIAYVRRGEDGPADFVRQRVELPIVADAKSAAVAASDSSWGASGTLQIGDRADDFTLPRADGTTISLTELRGDRHVLVTTYRAHW